jgi:putative molybdopterin biosynthesis protein
MININNMTNEQYYTVIEVAESLKVAYLTVYRWIQSAKLPAYKAGKQYRIKNTDLDCFVKSYKTRKAV